MASTYTLNNGIELIGTGEQSGTWGDTTNTNLSLLDTALDGQVTVTLAAAGTSGSPNTLPISDGAASDGRNRMVIFSDGGDLGATAYVQLTPNDAEKIIYVRNALSGSRSIILFQGTYNASNDYEVPAGTTAVIYFNGGGSGAVAANVFNNAYFDSLRLGSVSVTAILDEDDMSSDSATALATQQSIKAYVDSQVTAQDLDFAGDSGTGAVDLDSQSLTIAGTANEIETSASGQTLTIGLPDNVTIAGDLTVDTDTLYVDSTNDRVGINNTGIAGYDLLVGNGLTGTKAFALNGQGSSSSVMNIDLLGGGTGNPTGRIAFASSTEALSFSTGDNASITTAMTIDSSQRVLIKQTSDIATNSSMLQVFSTGAEAAVNIHRGVASSGAGYLQFQKSRNTTAGSYTIVSDGDSAGNIIWRADDGTTYDSEVAWISAAIDGTPGANDMPGRITFLTTADGASSATERMRIDQAGRVGIGTSAITGYNAYGDGLVVKKSSISGSSGMTIQAPDNAGYSSVYFGRPNDTKVGGLEYSHSLDGMFLISGNSTAMVLDSSQRVLIGTDTPDNNVDGPKGNVQIAGENTAPLLSVVRYSNNSSGPYVRIGKSRAIAAGSRLIVQDGDALGYLQFTADDGGDMNHASAQITAEIDGAPGANDLPGRLQFWTTADGNSSPTERMRISENGDVDIGQTGGGVKLAVAGAVGPQNGSESAPTHTFYGDNNTGMYRPAADSLGFSTGGTEAMRIDSSQRVLIGETSAQKTYNTTAYPIFQVSDYGFALANIISYDTVAGNYAQWITSKSNTSTIGTQALVDNGDGIGIFGGQGSDGTEFVEAASMRITVDGTAAANDMPGRITFLTTADGASAGTERMRINSSGDVGIGNTDPTSRLVIEKTSARTNDAENMIRIVHNTSGTSAVGFGSKILFAGERSNGTLQNQGRIGFVADVNTATNLSSALILEPASNGSPFEAMRLGSDGYPEFTSASQIRLTLGSEGTAGTNTANWIRGSGAALGLNAASDNIHFEIAGTEKMRVTGNGLTFNGDTAAANALDDYEEGTFTPEIRFGGGNTGITYTQQDGWYTKIGRLVTVGWEIVLSNKGTSTGDLDLRNLPVTIGPTQRQTAGSFYFQFMSSTFPAGAKSFYGIANTTRTGGVQYFTGASGTSASLNDTHFGNSSYWYGSFTYYVS